MAIGNVLGSDVKPDGNTFTKNMDRNMNSEIGQNRTAKSERSEGVRTKCCFFTKKRTGRAVMIPADRIWVIDISHCSGDTMVRTFDGDVVVRETFDETVGMLINGGHNLCVFSRNEGDKTRIGVPVERIVRIEKSERDDVGATIVITVDGMVCVAERIETAVEIVKSCGVDICEFHKRLDDGNPCYAVRSKISGIRMSPINGDTVVKCGQSRIVVTEGFEEACKIFGSD